MKKNKENKDREYKKLVFKDSLLQKVKHRYDYDNEEDISKRKKLINLVTILGLLLVLIVSIWAYRNGYFSEEDKLKNLLVRMGPIGPLVFIMLQLTQVVIPVIPGGVTNLIGVIAFGPLMGFVYNYIGIILGSVINFFLARFYGQAFVKAFVSDKTYNKYIGWLNDKNRFDKLFALAIFGPFAPDDFLCMLAGLTQMSFKKFLIILLLGKPASLLAYTFFLQEIIELLKLFIK